MFLCSIVMQNTHILRGSSHVLCYLFYLNVNYLLIQFITYLPCCGYVKCLMKSGQFAQWCSYLRTFKVIGK